MLVHPTVVPTASGVADRPPTTAPAPERPSPTELEVGHGSSTAFKAGSLGDYYIRAARHVSGLSTTATILFCNAWREGTKQQYNSTMCRWGEFCHAREIHPITLSINDVVGGLVWSLLLGVPLVISYMLRVYLSSPTIPSSKKWWKGHICHTRPPAPRYVVIWDTDVLLQYLDSLDNACLNFNLLSCKTAILMTILSGQQVSTIHVLRLSQLQLTTDMAIFNLGTTLLKHSRPSRSTPAIVFHRYPHRWWLCPLQTIQDCDSTYPPCSTDWQVFLSLTASPIIRFPRIP